MNLCLLDTQLSAINQVFFYFLMQKFSFVFKKQKVLRYSPQNFPFFISFSYVFEQLPDTHKTLQAA